MIGRTESTPVSSGIAVSETIKPRNIIVDASARDPLKYEGEVTGDEYVLEPLTVMVPVTNLDAHYIALQRSPCVSRAFGAETTIVVDDASPFRIGDVIRYRDVSDSYTAVAIGTIVDVHYDSDTLDIAGDVATGIAADDPVEVAYNDADMVLLLNRVCVLSDDLATTVDVAAKGLIHGQVRMSDLNMVGDWDDLVAQEMTGIDFIASEPGLGRGGLGTIGAGEIEDDAVTTSKIANLAVTNAKLADNAAGLDEVAADLTLGAVICIPVSALNNVGNNDFLMNGYVPGFRGKIAKLSFITGDVPASTASKDIDLTCQIGSTPTTGGLLTLLTASINAKGKVCNATAITAANEFSATDNISLKCVEATAAFVEGNGVFVIVLATA
jgi:hypothetical protein